RCSSPARWTTCPEARSRRPPTRVETPGRYSLEPDAALLHLPIREIAEVLEQVGQRRRQLAEVAGVEALVGGVGAGLRVLDAQEQSGGAAKQLGKRTDEADGAAAADRDRLDAVALLEGLHRRLERRTGRIGHPPLDGAG